LMSDILEKVETLFEACIKHLENSYKLYETQRSLLGKAKKQMVKDRSDLVKEIEKTVDGLEILLRDFHVTFTVNNRGDNNLVRLRLELEKSMETARIVEEKVNLIGNKVYDSYERE